MKAVVRLLPLRSAEDACGYGTAAERAEHRAFVYRLERVRAGYEDPGAGDDSLVVAGQRIGADLLRPAEGTHADAPVPSDEEWDGGPEAVGRDLAWEHSIEALLPDEYRQALYRVHPDKVQDRLKAIAENVEPEDLMWFSLEPITRNKIAKRKATEAQERYADVPEELLTPDQRRQMTPTYWATDAKNRARLANIYASAACGAAGGPDTPAREMYCSAFSLGRHRAEKALTAQIMGSKRIMRADDPKTQIPLSLVAEAGHLAFLAERRTIIDMMIRRAEELGYVPIWITLTLPGEWHPYPENEAWRKSVWNGLHPKQAWKLLKKMRKRYMARIRKTGTRPFGFYCPQPHVDETPHIHEILWAPTIEEARRLTDMIRQEFAQPLADKRTKKEKAVKARKKQCAAKVRVVGDDHPDYAPEPIKGGHKRGTKETVETVTRYLARYATRQSTKPGDAMERSDTWLTSWQLRSLTFVGVRQGGMGAWRTVMAQAKRRPPEAVLARAKAEAEAQGPDAKPDLRSEAEKASPRLEIAVKHARRCLAASKKAAELHAEKAINKAIVYANAAAEEANRVALAVALWDDEDHAESEAQWLCKAYPQGAVQEAHPIAVKEDRVSRFGERREVFLGLRGANADDDDPETLLALTEHEWVIVDEEDGDEAALEEFLKEISDEIEAQEAFEEWLMKIRNKTVGNKTVVSVIGTDPRRAPAGRFMAGDSAAPPDGRPPP